MTGEESWRQLRDNVRRSLSKVSARNTMRDEIITALRTYGLRRFAFMSDPVLTPLLCARNGWNCINPNLLECRSCQKRLQINVSPKLNSSGSRSLLNQIADQIIYSRHDKLCPFYSATGADDAMPHVRILSPDPVAVLDAFQTRFESLAEIQSIVEPDPTRIQLVPIPDIPAYISQDYRTVLAMCGWRASSDLHNVVDCEICGRSVPVSSSILRRRSTSESVSKRQRIDEPEDVPIFQIGDRVRSVTNVPLPGQDLFGHDAPPSMRLRFTISPINDHRSFCPWIQAGSSRETVGWQRCLQVLERDHLRNDQKGDTPIESIDVTGRAILNTVLFLT